MDKNLEKIIIEAFECGVKWNKQKGHYLNALDFIEENKEQLNLYSVGSSLPDLRECNQASLDYATKKDNPDFFLIKQTFKEGINWALNYVTKNK